MREIKFRAWDNKGKCMVPWGAMMQTAFNSGEQHLLYDIFCGHRLDVVLMQYTGLHDKNGTEIYEGDIVRLTIHREDGYGDEIEENHITKVYFESGSFWMSGDGISVNSHFHFNNSDREVIGNIHESPIKGQDDGH